LTVEPLFGTAIPVANFAALRLDVIRLAGEEDFVIASEQLYTYREKLLRFVQAAKRLRQGRMQRYMQHAQHHFRLQNVVKAAKGGRIFSVTPEPTAYGAAYGAIHWSRQGVSSCAKYIESER
jgi:hypothetical protein